MLHSVLRLAIASLTFNLLYFGVSPAVTPNDDSDVQLSEYIPPCDQRAPRAPGGGSA